MKYNICDQCDRAFLAKRATRRFCSATCRQRNHRKRPKISYYKSNHLDEREEVAALIAERHPKIFQALEDMRDKYGNRVLFDVLDILKNIVKSEVKYTKNNRSMDSQNN